MEIEHFLNEFTKEIGFLLEEGVLIGKEEFDELETGTFTLLFDIAIYNIAKRNNLTIIPENPVGRGGYSDMTLCSSDGKDKLIEIEHENKPLRKKNKRFVIYNALDKLMSQNAKYKVLITYTYKGTSKDIDDRELKKLCIEYLNKKYPTRKNIFLFYADNEFNAQEKFVKFELF